MTDFTYVGDKLTPGQKLFPNQALLSPNEWYALVMQDDGNLVLYPIGITQADWSSGTSGRSVAWAAMQSDGNFVVYESSGTPLWSSGTSGSNVAWIALQNDGNLVIYRTDGQPLWSSSTSLLSRLQYDSDITNAQRQTLADCHSLAINQTATCMSLTRDQKRQLRDTYRKSIRFSSTTKAGINAEATVGGSQIWINFGVLFPQGTNEIAQTLIHEMMHCAGFNHPVRRDPVAPMSCAIPNPSLFDCPFDNGVYYSTVPLLAEICIAGNQSDRVLLANEDAFQRNCTIDASGLCTIHSNQ
jgi:hypothetical protein